jgi:hypothetical protein
MVCREIRNGRQRPTQGCRARDHDDDECPVSVERTGTQLQAPWTSLLQRYRWSASGNGRLSPWGEIP